MFNLRASTIVAIAAFFLSFLIGLLNRTAMPMLIVRAIVFAVVFFVLVGLIYTLINRFLPELLAADSTSDVTDFFPGSQINIIEGDTADVSPGMAQGDTSSAPAVPIFMGAQADDTEEGLGNISDLMNKKTESHTLSKGIQGMGLAGMDQNAQDEYNKKGDLEELPGSETFTPWDPLTPLTGTVVPEGLAVSKNPPAPGKSNVPEVLLSGTAGVSDSEDFFPDLDSMAGAFSPFPASEGSDTADYSVSAPSSRRSRSNSAPAWSGDFNAKDMAMGLRTVLNKEKEG